MALKVLMATMGLGIGGAETHIVELAAELKRRGADVLVASNGGVYVAELEAQGIRHFRVPMNRRNAFFMLRSYFLMRRLIRAEKPDVVHAHARIPAFICGLLKKRLCFPFVTTAHWVFDISGSLRYLSDWGEKTIAVSEDIKEYLINNYNVADRDIFVTINGIDTEKFSARTSGHRILQEFGLDGTRPVITSVSRLDDSRALAASLLIDIAPELDKRLPGVQLLIAGGGDAYSQIKAKADAVNGAAGRRIVHPDRPQDRYQRNHCRRRHFRQRVPIRSRGDGLRKAGDPGRQRRIYRPSVPRQPERGAGEQFLLPRLPDVHGRPSPGGYPSVRRHDNRGARRPRRARAGVYPV